MATLDEGPFGLVDKFQCPEEFDGGVTDVSKMGAKEYEEHQCNGLLEYMGRIEECAVQGGLAKAVIFYAMTCVHMGENESFLLVVQDIFGPSFNKAHFLRAAIAHTVSYHRWSTVNLVSSVEKFSPPNAE